MKNISGNANYQKIADNVIDNKNIIKYDDIKVEVDNTLIKKLSTDVNNNYKKLMTSIEQLYDVQQKKEYYDALITINSIKKLIKNN